MRETLVVTEAGELIEDGGMLEFRDMELRGEREVVEGNVVEVGAVGPDPAMNIVEVSEAVKFV